ncbi:DUF192 domain-containing protein [Desulfoferula mesophila]|uniref:DUF192 domain-containing protein n=1 Tax=Desulfoferula mesophila TaxID=3058419 RepID=A0AAU9EEV4_9BACT|nr:hypothetical protein FAK_27040 [Desulfoferula mesophilus]
MTIARLTRKIVLVVLGLVLLTLAVAWDSPPAGGMPMVRVSFGQHQVLAEAPVSPAQRLKGLGGRQNLAPGQGMLFIFAGRALGMCMRDMKFPLDFVWLDQGKVCQIDPNVPAGGERVTVRAKVPAQMVLEVPSGWAQEHGVYVGQEVRVDLVSGQLPESLAKVIGNNRT